MESWIRSIAEPTHEPYIYSLGARELGAPLPDLRQSIEQSEVSRLTAAETLARAAIAVTQATASHSANDLAGDAGAAGGPSATTT